MVDDRDCNSVEASKSSDLVNDRGSENDEKQNQINVGGSKENSNKLDSDTKVESNSVWSAFKRQSAGVISEYKRKTTYLSPSRRRKLKAEIARKKRHKRNHNFGRGI